MNAADLLAEHAALLKRMIEELEETLGSTVAYPIASNLLIAYEALQREREVRR